MTNPAFLAGLVIIHMAGRLHQNGCSMDGRKIYPKWRFNDL